MVSLCPSVHERGGGVKEITLKDIKDDPQVKTYLEKADKHMSVIGYTEHGHRHAGLVADTAFSIISKLGYSRRDCELAQIAGYLHDIGNVVGRYDHGQVSALIAQDVLIRLGMKPDEVATVIGAIGNHEEKESDPVNVACSGLIIADKSDVHRSRVRNPNMITFDIHDRVNYAARSSSLRIDKPKRTITLELEIDTSISQVMEYFEIFLSRMIVSRRAAKFLKSRFRLVINKVRLL